MFEKLKQQYRLFSTSKAYKTVSLISDICGHLVPVYEKPNLLTCIKAISDIGTTVLNDQAFYIEDFFRIHKEEWEEEAIPGILIPLVQNHVKHCPFEIINTPLSKTHVIKIVTFDDVKIGWIVNKGIPDKCEEIFVEKHKFNNFKHNLKKHMWSYYGDANIVLRRKKQLNIHDKSNALEFAIDNLVDAMPSALAHSLSSKFQRAFNANENRSLLMFGPPGSGKSTMARQITAELKLKSFRLCVEDIDNDMTFFYDLISLFQPDAIILDDFDRSMRSGAILEMIAYIRKNVKLVIGTANDRDAIDEAVLRPERFDEIIFVDTLDEAVVRKMLGAYADEAYELVKSWPIVYIHEYCRRRKWLSNEEVTESFAELAERVERLKQYKPKQKNPLKLKAKRRSYDEEGEDSCEGVGSCKIP